MFEKYPYIIEITKTTVKDLTSDELRISVQANDEKSCLRLFENALENK